MELIQLLSFYQIAKTGSFSKASEHIFRSQSAVSHQIKNLEEELGIKLFDRLGKIIRLTEEGRILFDFCSGFFEDLDNLKKIYEDIQEGKCGNLTIVTSSAVITYILPNVIKTFIDQFPGIKFKLITCAITFEIPRIILNGEADFGIGPKMDHVCSEKLDFLSWKFFDKVVLVARDHPLCKKRNITLADVAKYPLILYREGTMIRKSVEEAFMRNNLSYEIVMEMDVAENIKRYVERGLGVSVLSSLAFTDIEKEKFCLFDINHLLNKTEYGIYLRKDKYMTTAMKEFIRFFAPEICENLSSCELGK